MAQITIPTVEYTAVATSASGTTTTYTGAPALSLISAMDDRVAKDDAVKVANDDNGFDYLNLEGGCICSVTATPSVSEVTVEDNSIPLTDCCIDVPSDSSSESETDA